MSENNEVTREELHTLLADESYHIGDAGETRVFGVYKAVDGLLDKFVITRKPEPLPFERELAEWADYFELFDSTVGSPALTPALVASLMRGPRPFGGFMVAE